jgi:hypothetical protein
MRRFVEEADRGQRTLLPECLDDFIDENNPVTEKLTKLKGEMGKLAAYEKQMLASPDQQISLTDPDSRSMATSGRGFRRCRLQCPSRR